MIKKTAELKTIGIGILIILTISLFLIFPMNVRRPTLPGAVAAAAATASHKPDASSAHAPVPQHSNPVLMPAKQAHEEQAKKISYYWLLPFACILLCIAVIPLVNAHWWRHNFKRISALFGIPMIVAMYILLPERAVHTTVEYLSFIALVVSLYVISGGIVIRGKFNNSPITNVIFLAIGAVLANLIGTAGASMVLIRPMLRINKYRKTKIHIFVFFIFIVSNIGGSLTPLGDPPLFLGFLQGVPFQWPLINLLPGWAFACGILLAVFAVLDTFLFRRDSKRGHERRHFHNQDTPTFQLIGAVNFLFLLGILGTVLAYGHVFIKNPAITKLNPFMPNFIQIILMCLMAFMSLAFTPDGARKENEFSWFPAKEVAILFAAIFACMIPALNILEYVGQHQILKVSHPAQFFWISGGLSSFLDNAPTYMTFLSLGKTLGAAGDPGVIRVIGGHVPREILIAISMGSVFMGANTYIGNAPNFMVKSICNEYGVKMPSFVHYMVWSFAILIPLFLLTTLVFF
jgi:Na+/H+ antiporter NhaD/arsenite permease-like protein